MKGVALQVFSEIGENFPSRCTVCSDKKQGIFAKVKNPYTGRWGIIGKELSSSYRSHHVFTKCIDKSHATHISPFSIQHLPFELIDGPDNQYGQMHAMLRKDPYIEASIEGFQPYQPYVELPTPKAFIVIPEGYTFPSLVEPNDEMFLCEPGEAEWVLSGENLHYTYKAYIALSLNLFPLFLCLLCWRLELCVHLS